MVRSGCIGYGDRRRKSKGERNLLLLKLHRNLQIRLATAFAFGTAQSTTTPFMAIYFAHSFGIGLTGILLALSVIAGLVGGMIGGYWADHVGRRNLLIWSEASFLLAYLVMASANSPWYHSAWVTFAAFFVTNICWGVYGPVDEAMLIDVTDVSDRPRVYGLFYWLYNLTTAVGAIIGSLAFTNYRFTLFAGSAGVLAVTLLVTILFIQETYPASQPQVSSNPTGATSGAFASGDVGSQIGVARVRQSMVSTYVKVLGNGLFVRYLLAGMFAMALEFQLGTYIGIHLEQVLHRTVSVFGHKLPIDGIHMLGWLQTENTILVVSLAMGLTAVANRIGSRKAVFLGLLVFTIGYSVLTAASSPLFLFAAMFIATLGEITSIPARQATLGDIAEDEARSAYLAVNGISLGGARLIASFAVLLGSVLPAWGMAIWSAAFGLTAMVLFDGVLRRIRLQKMHVTTGQTNEATTSF